MLMTLKFHLSSLFWPWQSNYPSDILTRIPKKHFKHIRPWGRVNAGPLKDVYVLILRTVTMLHGKRDFAGVTNLLDYYSDRSTVIKRVRGSQEGQSQRRWCDHPGSRGRKEDGMWDHKPRNENSPLKLEKARRQMVPWRLQKEPALLTFWL